MKKLSVCFLAALFVVFTGQVLAQNNVGIGIANPDASALLHLEANNKGVLVPRMTTAERTAIVNPANGLMVYDTDLQCFFFNRSGTWTSLCAAAGGGSDNITLNYDQNTGVLSLTDGAGTITTNIPAPGRWSVTGTTDINYLGNQTSGFSPMAGTQITFTPTKPVVYIVASAAGDIDIQKQAAGVVELRIQNTGNNTTVVRTESLVNSTYLNTTTFALGIAAAWNAVMTKPYNVTPGVPVTLEMQWAIGWSDGQPGRVNCNSATGASHRTILIYE